MNKIFLSGNLTRDPELNNYGNNMVAKTAIAVKRQFTRKDETDFFNIVAFNKTAEFLDNYFNKGSRIIIEGRLQQNNYTDKDGNNRTSYDVIVDNIEFGDSKKKASDNSTAEGNHYEQPPDDNFDNMPFRLT